MKQREFKKCCLCDRGMAHNNRLTFIRIRIERFCLNPRTIQRAAGLEMMIGPLAQIMGPDEDLAARVGKPVEALICEGCVLEPRGAWLFDVLGTGQAEPEAAR